MKRDFCLELLQIEALQFGAYFFTTSMYPKALRVLAERRSKLSTSALFLNNQKKRILNCILSLKVIANVISVISHIYHRVQDLAIFHILAQILSKIHFDHIAFLVVFWNFIAIRHQNY